MDRGWWWWRRYHVDTCLFHAFKDQVSETELLLLVIIRSEKKILRRLKNCGTQSCNSECLLQRSPVLVGMRWIKGRCGRGWKKDTHNRYPAVNDLFGHLGLALVLERLLLPVALHWLDVCCTTSSSSIHWSVAYNAQSATKTDGFLFSRIQQHKTKGTDPIWRWLCNLTLARCCQTKKRETREIDQTLGQTGDHSICNNNLSIGLIILSIHYPPSAMWTTTERFL